MKRLHDWQLRYEALARERRAVPFAWGTADCACWAADCVHALTGERPAMPGYRSAREALRHLSHMGGLENAANRLGPAVSPLRAGVGDVVLVRAGKRLALAVCNGTVALAQGRDGLVSVPMADAVAAWRVG